jgi:hypothetical protein
MLIIYILCWCESVYCATSDTNIANSQVRVPSYSNIHILLLYIYTYIHILLIYIYIYVLLILMRVTPSVHSATFSTKIAYLRVRELSPSSLPEWMASAFSVVLCVCVCERERERERERWSEWVSVWVCVCVCFCVSVCVYVCVCECYVCLFVSVYYMIW